MIVCTQLLSNFKPPSELEAWLKLNMIQWESSVYDPHVSWIHENTN